MLEFKDLKDVNYETLAEEIEALSAEKEEGELYRTIGTALYDSGMCVNEMARSDSRAAMFLSVRPVMLFDGGDDRFGVSETVEFTLDPTPVAKTVAENQGKTFMQKVKYAICHDSRILEIMSGEGKLKDYLKTGIPLLLGLIGVTALNPFALAIVAAVFALIIRNGMKAYCDIQ